MSDGKSFLERREQAEIVAAQIREVAPDAKSISLIESAMKSTTIIITARPRGPALENVARDIARGLEETFDVR